MTIEDVDPILPKMSLSDKSGAKFDAQITADGEGGKIVGVNVKLERGDCFHDE